ncbi:hypothetical protein HYU22_00900 [Candidatus Woesearchaeota archaeon]|nr:hypothetical protein [Candidatus Woesearchaeota archaeon]
MDKYIPPELKRYVEAVKFVLIYEGKGAEDAGKTIEDIVRERLPRALLDTCGYQVSARRGRVLDFERGNIVRPIIEEEDYTADYSHGVCFNQWDDVLSFMREQYGSRRLVGNYSPTHSLTIPS